MQIQHKESGSGGIFFIPGDGDDTLAELTYQQNGKGTIVIDHTGVDKGYRGKDLGLELINHAVEFARAQKMKILPVCAFARAVMQKKSAYKDVYIDA
jgi:uncharacterized protein